MSPTSTLPAAGPGRRVPDATFRVQVPDGWFTVRTGATQWHRDVTDAIDTLLGTHPDTADLRRPIERMLESVVQQAREAHATLVAFTIGARSDDLVELGTLSLALVDGSPEQATLVTVAKALFDARPEAFHGDNGTGLVVISEGDESQLPSVVAPGGRWTATAYLPLRETPYTLISSVSLTSGDTREAAKAVATRLVSSFQFTQHPGTDAPPTDV